MSNRQSSKVWMTLSSLSKNKSTGRQICDVVYDETLDPFSLSLHVQHTAVDTKRMGRSVTGSVV